MKYMSLHVLFLLSTIYMLHAADQPKIVIKGDDIVMNGPDKYLSELNENSACSTAKKIDFSTLKIHMGYLLQQKIRLFNPPTAVIEWPLGIFNSDGSQIILASEQQSTPIYLYDIHNKNIIKTFTLPKNTGRIRSIEYILNDSHIIVQISEPYPHPDTLYIYNIHNSVPIASISLETMIPMEPPYSIHASNLLIPAPHNVVLHRNIASDMVKNAIDIAAAYGEIFYADFSPQGSLIIIGTQLGYCLVYDANTLQQVKVIAPTGTGRKTPTVSPDDTKILIDNGREAVLYDIRGNNDPKETFHSETPIIDSLFSPDNTQILIHKGQSLSLYDAHSKQLLRQISLPEDMWSTSRWLHSYTYYSNDSTQILVLGRNNRLLIYDAKNDTPPESINLPPSIHSKPTYTKDDSHLFFTTNQGKIIIYDAKNLKQLPWPIIIHLDVPLYQVKFSPDNKYIFIATDEDFIFYPTLSNINFTDFSLDQLQLLFKAEQQWKDRRPYLIKTQNDATIYDTLDPILQDNHLFDFSDDIITQRLQLLRKNLQSETPTQKIKNFFASTTNTLYRWFGWQPKDISRSQGKESEKEEDI